MALVETILVGASILALLWASYTDLKQRMVADELPLALLALGFLAYLVHGIVNQSWQPIVQGTLLGGFAFIIGFGLWKIGFWAGGDVKLFAAISFLNPVTDATLAHWLGFPAPFPSDPFPWFPISWLLISVLSLLPLTILMAINRLHREPHQLQKLFPTPPQHLVEVGRWSIFAIGLHIFFQWMQWNEWLLLPLLLAYGFLPLAGKNSASILAGGAGFGLQPNQFVVSAVELFVILGLTGILIRVVLGTRFLFRTTKSVSQLQEGDILTQRIRLLENGEVRLEEVPSFWEMIKNPKNLGLVNTGTEIASPHRANGLEANDVERIQAWSQNGQLPATLEVKESTAFVPAMLIGYLFLQLIGNPLWVII